MISFEYNHGEGEAVRFFHKSITCGRKCFFTNFQIWWTRHKNGKLFCTASPCELCSKKAFQLGIKDIYYIDPYPGIALKHIIRFGKEKEYSGFAFVLWCNRGSVYFLI